MLPSGCRAGPDMQKLLQSLLSLFLLTLLLLCAMPLLGFWGRSLHWTLDLASHFILPAVIAACALSILAGLVQRVWTGAGALAIAITASLSVSAWTSTPRHDGDVLQNLSVMQFNVWFRNSDTAQVIETIKRSEADLVVLIEALPPFRQQLVGLEQIYPYKLSCPDSDPCGMLVLSKVPLEARGVKRTEDDYRSPILSFVTNVAACPVIVHAVHLVRPFPFEAPEAQLQQAREVGRIVSEFPGPKIVLGDFNAAPWSRTMQAVTSMGGVSLVSGAGGTWPAWLPRQMRIPIDHVAASPELRLLKREVLPPAGSDHAPVLARLGVAPGACVAN